MFHFEHLAVGNFKVPTTGICVIVNIIIHSVEWIDRSINETQEFAQIKIYSLFISSNRRRVFSCLVYETFETSLDKKVSFFYYVGA